MAKTPVKNSKTFLENNVKQVVYASLTDLEWLKKNIGKADNQEIIQQIERTVNVLAQCMDDIDTFIVKK